MLTPTETDIAVRRHREHSQLGLAGEACVSLTPDEMHTQQRLSSTD